MKRNEEEKERKKGQVKLRKLARKEHNSYRMPTKDSELNREHNPVAKYVRGKINNIYRYMTNFCLGVES